MSEKPEIDGRFTFNTALRMPFSNLFEPVAVGKKGKAKGDPKYSGTFLIPVESEELTRFKAHMAMVARARWPGRSLQELKFPIRSGEKAAEKAKSAGRDGAFYLGHMVISARSKYAPRLAILNGRKVDEYLDDRRVVAKPKFYNGCFVVPGLNIVAYEGQAEEGFGNPDGLTAYLDDLLWVKDGPRIGGGSAVDRFKGYVGSVSQEDPTGGESWDNGSSDSMDDEIPF